jgi:hypothetical protein
LLAAVPAQSQGTSEVFYSHVAEGLGFYTGVAFVNPHGEPAHLTVETFDRTGGLADARGFTLPANSYRARLLSEIAPAAGAQVGGFVRVTSSLPVYSLEVFGTTSLSVLADVAVQGTRLESQPSGQIVRAAAGAILRSADGFVVLSLPAGALAGDSPIDVSSLDPAPLPPTPNGQRAVGAVELSPAGTILHRQAVVRIPLNVHLTAGTLLPVFAYDRNAAAYTATDFAAVVDESGRNAFARVSRLGTFAVSYPFESFLVVRDVSPRSGAPGTLVAIIADGTDYTVHSNNVVTFAGPENTAVLATVVSRSGMLVVAIPEGAVTGDVIVRNGTRSSTGIRFTIGAGNPVPVITSVTPPNGMTAGFGEIAVTGTGVRANSVLLYDGAPIAAFFAAPSTITASLPGDLRTVGMHRLEVFTPGPGGGTSSPVAFEVFSHLTAPYRNAQLIQMAPIISNGRPGQLLSNSLVFKVVDQFGNGRNDVPITITTTGGGTVVGNNPVMTQPDGTTFVTIRLSAGSGVKNFTASVPDAPPVNFSIVAAEDPVSIVQLTGLPSVLPLRAAFPWKVRVYDANGNPVPSVPVVLSVSTPAGPVGSNHAFTNGLGELTMDMSFSTPGRRLLQVQPFGAVQFLQHELTIIPAEPTKIVKTSGDAQTGTVGAPLLKQLVATVQDSAGNGIPDVPVSVAVVSGGGVVLSGSSLITDANGRVYATAVAGGPGQQTFQFAVQRLLPIVFTATASSP